MKNRRLVLNYLDQLEGQLNNLKYAVHRSEPLHVFNEHLEKCEDLLEEAKGQIEREEIIPGHE